MIKLLQLIFCIISFCSIFLLVQSEIDSTKAFSDLYQRLASSYCHIKDYPTWLEQQLSFHYFLQFVQYFDIDTDRIKEIRDQYRLQYECLRAIERLPILIGHG